MLGPFDRVLGGGFGALKGLLGATLFFLLANLATDMVYGPEAERPAFHLALGRFTRGRPYLLALSADGAVRWSDDGRTPVGPVSEEHRASASAALGGRSGR